MNMPRKRLDGCACTSPLAHFYIYHSQSSIRELHPFTTITHLASEDSKTPRNEDDLRIQFLFKKKVRANEPRHQSSTATKAEQGGIIRTLAFPKSKSDVEWTEKIASNVDARAAITSTIRTPLKHPSAKEAEDGALYPTTDVSLRLEGPYFTPADPSRYQIVLCLVAGTGISGAIAIAHAFEETQKRRGRTPLCDPRDKACIASMASSTWKRCLISWSVREEEYVDLPFLQGECAVPTYQPLLTHPA